MRVGKTDTKRPMLLVIALMISALKCNSFFLLILSIVLLRIMEETKYGEKSRRK